MILNIFLATGVAVAIMWCDALLSNSSQREHAAQEAFNKRFPIREDFSDLE